MKSDNSDRIVVAGAGAVGCYIGGCLARAGRDVGLLLRAPLAEAIARHGLRITSLDGDDDILEGRALSLDTAPEDAFAAARIILVTVKSRDTDAMARHIARSAPPDSVIVSMQNGVTNAAVIRRHTMERRVIPAMVPFNVVPMAAPDGPPRFHRASSGTIRIAAGTDGLASFLRVPGAAVREHGDIDAVLWSKLVLNLNNAVNALCGLPLAAQLGDRRWRRLLARQMREALAVLRAAGVRPARIEGVNPRLIPLALGLPDRLFRIAARRMLAIDPEARSSMTADLERGRPTEIDQLQGAILDLAANHGVAAPLTRRIAEIIRTSEEAGSGLPRLQPFEVEGDPQHDRAGA